jgi:serine/threonine-protein kinase RIO1
MVRTWAEKEMRNLKRLASVGIACPVPHLLKSHVLVMDFLGVKGWCAPRLKDASLTQEQSMECYISIVIDMRRMYHECNLVHGDLSEYNVLWHEEKPVIIDVSQSVEQAHPFSSEFLRKDITNITDFFAKKNLNILTKTELFEFIIDKYLLVDNNLNSHNNNSIIPVEVIKEKLVSLLYKKFYDIDKINSNSINTNAVFQQNNDSNNDNNNNNINNNNNTLSKSILSSDNIINYNFENNNNINFENNDKKNSNNDNYNNSNNDDENKADVDEAVFLRTFIPTSLNDFSNPQQEMERIMNGQRESVYEKVVRNMLGGNSNNNNNNFNSLNINENLDNCVTYKNVIKKNKKNNNSINNNNNSDNVLNTEDVFVDVESFDEEKNKKQPDNDNDTNYTNNNNNNNNRKVEYSIPKQFLLKSKKEKQIENNINNDDNENMTQNNENINDDNTDNNKNNSNNKNDIVDNNNNNDNNSDNNSNEDDDDSNSEDDNSYNSSIDENGKYRKQLPSRQDAERRKKEKEARKELRKTSKSEKAEKRKNKIPKHVKKRAMKSGKK